MQTQLTMSENEYKTRLNELLCKMLHVDTKVCKVEYNDTYYRVREAQYRMCKINGIKYVQVAGIAYKMTERKPMLIRQGFLKESDMPYFYANVANRRQACIFVNLDALVRQEDKLHQMLGYDDFYYNRAKAVISHAQKEQVENVIIDMDIFECGQQAYRDIQQLRKDKRMSDARQERERDEQYEREQEARRIEEGKQEERTLRDLVEQIEAMGWNVQLTLKK